MDRELLGEIQQELEAHSGTAAADVDESRPDEDVLRALVPGLSLNEEALQEVEERFDFAVTNSLDAREFFSLLVEGTEYSVVVHPSISGSISALDLKNVTVAEAMEQVADLYGFRINRAGDIWQVLPGGMETRMFKVDYLNVQRDGTSTMQLVASGILNSGNNNNNQNNGFGNFNNGGFNNNNFPNGQNGSSPFGNQQTNQSGGGATITTTTETDYWSKLEEIITTIIESGGQGGGSGGLLGALGAAGAEQRSVIVDPQSGMIVVRAYPEELNQVAEFLSASQKSLQTQVVLEAKILEVELKEAFQSGIDITALGRVNSTNRITGVYRFQGDSLDSLGSPLAVSYEASDFTGVIRLLETQGNVQVISSPRISTLNNQKAVFKVGDEEYFITDTSSQFQGVGDDSITATDVTLAPFFSGIALDVTPQVSEQGDVILHIHPILNTVTENIKVIADQEFPLASSTTRESDSIARARNGEVIIISGLMQTRARGSEAGVPGARNIPVVGNALEQKQTETVKTELVILLRAIVDEGNNMRDLIQDHNEGVQDLRRLIDPYYR